jgi:large subunit ribosomal protein L40e
MSGAAHRLIQLANQDFFRQLHGSEMEDDPFEEFFSELDASGLEADMDVDAETTGDDEMPSKRPRHDLPVEEMFQIFIVTLSGRTVDVWCHSGRTIAYIKMMLISKLGLFGAEPHDLRLMFIARQLAHTSTLSDYNITSGSVLHMVAPPPPVPDSMQIFVKTLSSTTVVLRCHSGMTIAHIKNVLMVKLGLFAAERQDLRLIFAGRQLEDTRTLSHYNTASGCVLHMVSRLRGGC